MEPTEMAREALDSAKSAHHRIDRVEAEVKDIRNLTVAMGRIDQKVDGLDSDVKEIKEDVKKITGKPGRLQDKVVGTVIAALATGLVGALLALLLK